MILEIKQLMWLQTPKGQGIAKFMIDSGPEADLMWVCIIQQTGEIWTFSNWDVRACDNITLGRNVQRAAKKARGTRGVPYKSPSPVIPSRRPRR